MVFSPKALQYLSNFIGAAAAAALMDYLVEALNIDFLNQTPIVDINGRAKSNFELIIDVFGFIAAGGGIMATITNKRFMGMGPDEFFYGTGAIWGKDQYENWGAQKLGLRKEVLEQV